SLQPLSANSEQHQDSRDVISENKRTSKALELESPKQSPAQLETPREDGISEEAEREQEYIKRANANASAIEQTTEGAVSGRSAQPTPADRQDIVERIKTLVAAPKETSGNNPKEILRDVTGDDRRLIKQNANLDISEGHTF